MTTPWRELTDEEQHEWASHVVEFVKVDYDNRVVSANGVCPTCNHSFHFSDSDVKIVTKSATSQAHWTNSRIEVPIRCTCTEDHSNRPKELKDGCGAGAWFEDSINGS